jgi:hypothetical protein
MTNIDVQAWGHSQVILQAYDHSYDDSYDNFYDDGFDFPPTSYPVRELVTCSLSVSGVIALLIWGGSKLLPAIV